MIEHPDTDVSWNHILVNGNEINDCMNAGMNAYLQWNIVLFYGPVGEEGRMSKHWDVILLFVIFVHPGYFRVAARQNLQKQVYLSAYRDDSRVVFVAINLSTESVDQTYILQDRTVAGFTPFCTSNTKDYIQRQRYQQYR